MSLVTPTVKLAVPVAVGVPSSTPLVESDNPAGKFPDETMKVNGPGVPVAVSVWLYAVPPVPSGNELGDMVRGAGSIVSVYARVPTPVALVTLIVNDAMPSAVGVPVNAPAALSDNPAGINPALTLY